MSTLAARRRVDRKSAHTITSIRLPPVEKALCTAMSLRAGESRNAFMLRLIRAEAAAEGLMPDVGTPPTVEAAAD